MKSKQISICSPERFLPSEWLPLQVSQVISRSHLLKKAEWNMKEVYTAGVAQAGHIGNLQGITLLSWATKTGQHMR